MSARFAATPHAAHDVADALAPIAPELGERTAMDLRLLATELVANAVRHTGVEAGTVEVELRVAPRTVHLTVSDDGPGFEPPERPIATPEGPGGWGLYLVDQCARAGGGGPGRHRVWLELASREALGPARPSSPWRARSRSRTSAGSTARSTQRYVRRAQPRRRPHRRHVHRLLGLSSLLTASARARERRPVALVLAEDEPPSIFRFRGVDRLLALYGSREAALAGLS